MQTILAGFLNTSPLNAAFDLALEYGLNAGIASLLRNVWLCFGVITLCFLTLNLAQPFTPLFWRSESSQSDKDITDNIEPMMKSTEKHNVNLVSKVRRSVGNTESTS